MWKTTFFLTKGGGGRTFPGGGRCITDKFLPGGKIVTGKNHTGGRFVTESISDATPALLRWHGTTCNIYKDEKILKYDDNQIQNL